MHMPYILYIHTPNHFIFTVVSSVILSSCDGDDVGTFSDTLYVVMLNSQQVDVTMDSTWLSNNGMLTLQLRVRVTF
jgi:hypothetical protein